MMRIALRLLLAVTLIFQGIAGAFAETQPQAMHGPCCPHGAQAGQAVHHLKCPCPQKQRCASDCQLMCATVGVQLIAPQPFAISFTPLPSAQPARRAVWLPAGSDSPPIRPPIA